MQASYKSAQWPGCCAVVVHMHLHQDRNICSLMLGEGAHRVVSPNPSLVGKSCMGDHPPPFNGSVESVPKYPELSFPDIGATREKITPLTSTRRCSCIGRSLTHPNFSNPPISVYALQPNSAEPYCRRQPVAQQACTSPFQTKSCRSHSSGRGCLHRAKPSQTGPAPDQPTHTNMAKKGGGGGGEGSKKAAGQARKAEAAANKKAAEDSKKAAVEDAEWSKGSKKASAKK